jgi:hypothetical protein
MGVHDCGELLGVDRVLVGGVELGQDAAQHATVRTTSVGSHGTASAARSR